MHDLKHFWFEVLVMLLCLIFMGCFLYNEAFGQTDNLAHISHWELYFFKVDSSDIRVTDTYLTANSGDTLQLSFDQPVQGSDITLPNIVWKQHIDTTVVNLLKATATIGNAANRLVPVSSLQEIVLDAGFYQLSLQAVDYEIRKSGFSQTVLLYLKGKLEIPVNFQIIVNTR